MKTDRELMQQALEALEANRRTHYYCEDSWYSCPKHEDGCANEAEGNECNCGADKANAEIDYVTAAIKEALAQPEQEPVAWADEIIDDLHAQYNTDGIKEIDSGDALIRLDEAIAAVEEAEKRHTTPPQRTWVGLTDEEISDLWCKVSNTDFVTADTHVFARAIEAKLKENT